MNLTRWIKREWQRYRASHLLIIATLVLGVGGVFLIERLKEAFLSSIRAQERELLSSDLALSARRPLAPAELKRFHALIAGQVAASYRVLDMSSMLAAPAKGVTRLVEVRVVEAGFPFYGRLESLEGGLSLSTTHPLFTENCLWLHDEVARLLEVQLGDELRLGEGSFRHCGTILKDTTLGFRGFALAPRVYLGRPQLARTQLLGMGTMATHAEHIKFKTPVSSLRLTDWRDQYVKEFDDPAIRLQRPADTSEQTARSGKLFGDYLQLASLVALLLAVVGCFYLFRTLVHRRLKDIAILRALGVSPHKAAQLLMLPLVLDFFLALPLAAGFSALLYPLVTQALEQWFGTILPVSDFPWAIWPALPLILVMVLATLMPSVSEATTAPITGLLQDQERAGRIPRRTMLLWGSVAVVAFFGLAVWAAHSWKMGGLFVLGIIVAVLLLVAVAWILRWPLEKILRHNSSLSAPAGLLVGLVIRRLLRRPVTTLLSIIALGLGSVLISFLGHLELSMSEEFTVGQGERPALFLFDIQDEQTSELQALLAREEVSLQAISPMVRGKLVAINSKALAPEQENGTFQTREAENEARTKRRMMNLSWAAGLNPSEKLTAGVPFDLSPRPGQLAQLSLEQRFAQRLGIELGDRLTFEILGVPLEGRVVNLRSVKWSSFRPNFFITFAPGALEEAPKSWLAAIGPLAPARQAKLQNDLARRFPNISALDVGQLVQRMLELFSRLKQALQLMALFALLVGMVVVSAMAQDQVLRRQAEVMLEKALGLSPWQVSLMVMGEFITLAALAFTLGGVTGAALAGVVSVFIFEGGFVWAPTLLVAILVGGLILVSIPLLWMARRLYTWRPAGLLQPP